MKKDTLDFIIIGVQKSGTTSLYKYLSRHPQIYMPPEKDAIFFAYDNRYEKGVQWFHNEFYVNAPQNRLWGKATPQYMLGYESATSTIVAQRIKKTLPNVKIIAILRHPISRAFSHYRMSVRKGYETRSFEEVISAFLEPSQLQTAREIPSEVNSYIVQGEYGRILGEYYKLFQKEQIFVGYTDDLENNPETFVKSILIFLGLTSDIMPDNVGKRYYEGGTKLKIPKIKQFYVKDWDFLPWKIRLLLRRLPKKHRDAFSLWFHLWNVKPDPKLKDRWQEFISPELQEKLIDHYKKDLQALQENLGVSVPWIEWGNSQEAAQTCLT